MVWGEVLLLALVQGLTEFLPVSSSGHLVILQKLLDFQEPPVLLDICLHLGTLVAILVFFGRDWWELICNWRREKALWVLLIIGSIPTAVAGWWLNSKTAVLFDSLFITGGGLLVSGLLLLSTKVIPKAEKGPIALKQLNYRRALLIGLCQALAILPGVSRSGSTITAGLWQRLKPSAAFAFSFLLAVPAILGAGVMQLGKNDLAGWSWYFLLIPALVAGMVGFLALKQLRVMVTRGKLNYFGWYCLAVGGASLIWAWIS